MKKENVKKNQRRQINFRLSEDEWEWLEYQIQRYNLPMSVSAYAKQQAVNGYVNCLGIAQDDVKLITTSLARIGNNINQIAKLYHQGKFVNDITTQKIFTEVQKMKKLLFDLLKIKNEKKLITKNEKKSKLFWDLLEKNNISRSVGYDVYFTRCEILAKNFADDEKIILLTEALKEKNISLELAAQIEQIIISVEKNFNGKKDEL